MRTIKKQQRRCEDWFVACVCVGGGGESGWVCGAGEGGDQEWQVCECVGVVGFVGSDKN
jgi:hypothetical protein